ncbi:MAG: hypothetical protein KC589_03810, partial [Nanoarchaeota archaeon]|nr:hypothetical protein [Nanoarchaeota archaeon]
FKVEIIGDIEISDLSIVENNIYNISKKLRKAQNLPKDIILCFNLLSNLRNLIIYSSFYKLPMLDEENNYIYGDFSRFIEILTFKFDEDYEYYDEIEFLVQSLKTYYTILTQTKRYNELYHYKANCKNSFLIDYLLNIKESKQIAIIYYENIEKRIIQEQFNEIEFKNIEITLINYNKISTNTSTFDIVIFPGIKGNISKFLNSINKFNNVKILSYINKEHDFIKNKITLNEDKYILETIDSFKEFNKIPKSFQEELKTLSSKYSKNNSHKEAEDFYQDLIEKILENNSIEKDLFISSQNSKNKLSMEIKSLETGELLKIYCGEFTIFNKIIFENNSHEKVIYQDLKPGDYIFKLGNDENEIFKLFEEAYKIDDSIDFDLIKDWNNWFYNNIETKKNELSIKLKKDNIKITDLYTEYLEHCKNYSKKSKTYQTFLSWLKGKLIGPDDETDLLILGELVSYPEIDEIYKDLFREMRKLRRLHVIIGKQLNKIIGFILDKKDSSNLDYQEQFIYEKLKLFEIIKK